MKLPRDLSGEEIVKLLNRHFGYRLRRSRGSHMTVTLVKGASEHSITVPQQRDVRVGTLGQIVSDVAAFVGLPEEVGPTAAVRTLRPGGKTR